MDVPRETSGLLEALSNLILDEAKRQNLVSAASIPHFELRHIADSVQLLPLLKGDPLIDIGSGAGFPGLVLACCRLGPVHLIEPRTKRADFLCRAVTELGLAERVTVHAARAERIPDLVAGTITARAVASLDALFGMAEKLARPGTRWVLPKGRSANAELAAARETWQGDFRLVPSATDPEASIVMAENIRRRQKR